MCLKIFFILLVNLKKWILFLFSILYSLLIRYFYITNFTLSYDTRDLLFLCVFFFTFWHLLVSIYFFLLHSLLYTYFLLPLEFELIYSGYSMETSERRIPLIPVATLSAVEWQRKRDVANKGRLVARSWRLILIVSGLAKAAPTKTHGPCFSLTNSTLISLTKVLVYLLIITRFI